MSTNDPHRSIVTGGAGFIGSTLVDALVSRGDEVLIVDTLATGRRSNLLGAEAAGARLVDVDVRDAVGIDRVVGRFRPDRIFHLAAQIDVRRSVGDPVFDAAVNVLGTINVLESARNHGVRRVVNTSTGGAIYGTADLLPTPETAAERPLAAYGTSKLCGELYCAWFARIYGLSTATVRLANVYGPRQDPLGEAGVVAIFCDRLLAGDRPVVYGDGAQTRDFVFVEDVVAAQLAVAGSTRDGAFNVGTGCETSVLQLIDAVARAGGVAPDDFRPVTEAGRAGEVVRSCLDGGRAKAALGFAPSTPLVAGLARTLAWVEDVRGHRDAPAEIPVVAAVGAPDDHWP